MTDKPKCADAYIDERYIIRDEHKQFIAVEDSLHSANLQHMELPGSSVEAEPVLIINWDHCKAPTIIPLQHLGQLGAVGVPENEEMKVRRVLREMPYETFSLLKKHMEKERARLIQEAFEEGWGLGWASHKNEVLVAASKADMAPHYAEDWESSETRSKL